MAEKPVDKITDEARVRRTPQRIYQRPIGLLHRGRYLVLQGHQLSEVGLLLSSPERLQLKGLVLSTLVMPGGEHVIARGEILVEVHKPGGDYQYDVRFVELPLHQRRNIRNYVAAKTKEEALEESRVAQNKKPS